MPTHQKARELANAFEAAYPDELAKRLEWWCHVLGVDRVRFLRMIGMSAKEANNKKNQEWDTILEDRNRMESGWRLEGKLLELLSLFDYDWQALAERLHRPLAQDDAEKPARTTRARGEIECFQYVPNGDDTKVLLNIMAEEGPQALSAVLAYLSTSSGPAAQRA